MTYTEENEMRGTEFFKKVLVPVGSAALLAALFYPLCVENSQCELSEIVDIRRDSFWRAEDVPVDHPKRL